MRKHSNIEPESCKTRGRRKSLFLHVSEKRGFEPIVRHERFRADAVSSRPQEDLKGKSKECMDRFDAGSRCRTGGRRMIRNRPDRTARGRSSPRPGAATVRFAPQDTPPARIHSVRRTHTNEKPRRNSAGLLTDRSDIWRKRRDSNPRYPFEVYTLSRRAPSTARTLFPDRPLRQTRASGDQTCRKVRKFLKIKNTGGAFARSARTLSLAGRSPYRLSP